MLAQEAMEEEHFWEKDGNALISRRILVSWAKGQKYEATVTHYDPKDGQHYVVYDDGDKKWYDLRTKTFWVVGDPEKILYEPRPNAGKNKPVTAYAAPTVTSYGGTSYGGGAYGGGYGGYQHVWTPYVSNLPNARTAATFHCLVDPRMLQENERVVVCGNLDEMGGWDNGIVLAPHARSGGTLWEATLDLPFSLIDSCAFGMFQFSYKIVNSETGAEVSEGNPVRTENSLQLHFYHVFRNNYSDARFRGWTAPYGKAVVEPIVRLLLQDLQHGDAGGAAPAGDDDAGSLRGLLSRFKCLCADVATATRGQIEDVFDDEVKSGNVRPSMLMALVGMIGHFGPTTKEKVYTNTAAAYSYTYVNGAAQPATTTTLSYRKPPDPRPWCHHLLTRTELVAGQWFHLKLFTEVGPHSQWLVAGVGECVERLSYHNSYAWLRLMPLLMRHHCNPEIYDNTHHANAEREFMLEAAKCVTLAEEQLNLAVAQRAQHAEQQQQIATASNGTGLAAGQAGNIGGDTELMGLAALGVTTEYEHFAPPAAELARAWLSALIKHSPTVDQLAMLVLNSLRPHLVQDPSLVAPFAEKVEELGWGEASSLEALTAMVLEAAPTTLKHPTVAAALLRNKTPPKDLNRQVLTLVVKCLDEEFKAPAAATGGAAAGGAAAASDALTLVPSGNEMGENELVGDWMNLNNAAKDWVRRIHEGEPARLKADAKAAAGGDDDDEDDGDGWNSTGWWTRNKGKGSSAAAGKKKKQPHVPLTQAEVAALRAECLKTCFSDVDRLLETPFFARNPKGILFDVGRCWFFRGPPVVVLEAICALAKEGGGAKQLGVFKSSKLQEHLASEALKLAKGTSHSVAEVTRLLQVVRTSLSPAMPLAHDLLATLARDATWPGQSSSGSGSEAASPPLASILRNKEMWQQILAWCREGGVLGMSSGLVTLVGVVETVLSEAAAEVQKDSVNLKTLTTLLTGGGSTGVGRFLSLLGDFAQEIIVSEVKVKLVDLAERKEIFDDRLQRCQAYASFFCVSAGVKIDAGELRRTVDKLTSGYDRLKVSEIKDDTTDEKDEFEDPLEAPPQSLPPPPPKFTFTGFSSSSSGDAAPPSASPSTPFVFGAPSSAPFQFGSGTPAAAGGAAEAEASESGFTARLRAATAQQALKKGGALGSVPTEVDWLYDLRSSELFLGLWRAAASEVLRDAVAGAAALIQEGQGEGGGAAAAEEEDEEDEVEEMPPLPEEMQGDDAAIQQFIADQQAQMQARAQTRATARQARAEARFARQDEEKRVREELASKVLSQEEVVWRLLPKAKTAWRRLAAEAAVGSLSVSDLDKTFGKLSEAQMKDELRLLYTTTSSSGGGNGKNQWDVEEALDKLTDYRLLRKLGRWLPATIAVHGLLVELCSSPLEDDSFRATMIEALARIESSGAQLNMSSIPQLVVGVRGVFAAYSEEQLDFLATLGDSPALISWLLKNSEQKEFNEMLNVIRPCTDDPRLLSAIASLVYVRTLLIDPLYSNPPYDNLQGLMRSFTAIKLASASSSPSSAEGSPLWHLQNIVETFDRLLDMFENQTKSPSIKSLHNLRDLMTGGTFVLRLGVPADQVLSVHVATAAQQQQQQGADGAGTTSAAVASTVHDMEGLLDLRSNLLLAEIPEELEEEFAASVLVDSFVQQLQVMSDTADALQLLFAAGHASYQVSYRHTQKVSLDGLAGAQEHLKTLQVEAEEWGRKVRGSRDRFYFLNFYSIAEVLHIRDLVLHDADNSSDGSGSGDTPTDEACGKEGALAEAETGAVEAAAAEAAAGEAAAAMSTELDMVTGMGFPQDHAEVALRRCDNNVDQAIEFLFSHSMHMDRLVSEEAQQRSTQGRGGGSSSLAAGFGGGGGGDSSSFLAPPVSDPLEDFTSVLYAVSSCLDESLVPSAMTNLKQRLLGQEEDLLSALGHVLESLFGANPQEAASLVGRRALPEPGSGAANRSDMLIAVDHADGTKSHPIFCTATDAPEEVIEAVLSVYVRRGRLPEPGEVLFATAQTSLEEVELLIRRFLKAADHGRGDQVFCLADLHVLSYTQQCGLVDRLRALLADAGGTGSAATLLLVSGRQKQVALNQLSQYAVDIPSLQQLELQKACKAAFEHHLGPTSCISSVINGGGKSHYIKKHVAELQREGQEILYGRCPIRESTTTASLVEILRDVTARIRGASGGAATMALHLDVAHIIPASANTMLFELLVVGLLRDVSSCRMFHRNRTDRILLELPNSPGNKSAQALRFVSLLPTKVLECCAETMDLVIPAFVDTPMCSRLALPEYSEAKFVARWVRGFKAGKLKPSDAAYDPSFNAYADGCITSEEVFAELSECCCQTDGPAPRPSFAAFRQFAMFMNEQFTFVEAYPLLDGGTLAMLGGGWPTFKHSFVRLMIETARDFSLRSVAQVAIVGPPPPAKQEQAQGAAAAVALGEGGAAEAGVGDSEGALLEGGNEDGDEFDDLPPPPVGAVPLLRRTSSSLEEEAQRVAAAAPAPLQRETTLEMAARFGGMRSWESSDHPIVLFKLEPRDASVSGVDLMSLNSSFVDRYLDRQLRAELEASGIDFKKDWTKIGNDEAARRLREVEGLFDRAEGGRGGVEAMDPGYTLTVDNLLKMISIQLRLKFNLPVVVMGETGCGKSSLIRNLCAIIGAVLRTLNIHGGMDDQTIVSWMQREVDRARSMRGQRVVIFFDEVNTCNAMGCFKEMICDRTLNGVPIPDNMKIIAACNPYRLRTTKGLYGGEEMAGLVYDHHGATHSENVGTGIKDPLRNLVYRVHPLPESLIDYIFDFGALSSETEKIYIKSMLKKALAAFNPEVEDDDAEATTTTAAGGGGTSAYSAWTSSWNKKVSAFEEFIDVYTDLVCAAQECIRSLCGGERSSASLRDVRRCVDVFQWFGRHFFENRGPGERWSLEDFFSLKGPARPTVRKAVILSIAFCYHARLPRKERSILVNAVTAAWRKLQVQTYIYTPPAQQQRLGGGGGLYGGGGYGGYQQAAKCEWLRLDVASFNSVLEETQRAFTREFNVGPGIALNEALCENLFMILVSVLNQIPIFVIGKPGSSKSLAMGLVQSNLNGSASETPFLRSLPAVEVFPYQCSPLSTSAGIELAFASAQRYRREAPGTVVVVLLDEVGLAEQSPHLPLKVLHKTLDEAGYNESVVGISNWALDPAKMNRAVHLYRPAPTVEDLSLTAEGMVRSANLKGYLQALARAYSEVYHSQLHPDFWGLREFYSTVRAINGALSVQREAITISAEDGGGGGGGGGGASGSSSLSAGGSVGGGAGSVALDGPMLLNAVLRNFGGRPHEVEKVVTTFFRELGLPLPRTDVLGGGGVEALVRSNLREPSARHLMLLTKSNAALGLLFDRDTLSHEKTEIIFGSDFPLDQTDLQVCLDIQRVKLCMASGVTAVLVHCESLYESLYDLLNQHYSTYGGQLYVRLAFGTQSRLCPIHPTFRVVCVVEKTDAYEKLAPPLLNRFEKQVLERSGVLLPEDQEVLQKLRAFCQRFTSGAASSMLPASPSSSSSGSAAQGTSMRGTGAMRVTFCGFHSDLLSSLILTTRARLEAKGQHQKQRRKAITTSASACGSGGGGGGGGTVESVVIDDTGAESATETESNLVRECITQLLWIAAPERVCRLLSTPGLHGELKDSFGVDVGATYFQHQKHSSLPTFAESMLGEWSKGNEGGSGVGAACIVTTHAPLTSDVVQVLSSESSWKDVSHIVLHELDQERELRNKVGDFFKAAADGSVLLVQCDPLATSIRRIEHAKFILEQALARYVQQVKEAEAEAVGAEAAIKEVEKTPLPTASSSSKASVSSSSGAAAAAAAEEEVQIEGRNNSGGGGGDSVAAVPGSAEDSKIGDPSDDSPGKGSSKDLPQDCSGSGEGEGGVQKVAKVNHGVHVILLLHLPRGIENKFCLSFDLRWKYVFVDSTASAMASGLPDVDLFIGRQMIDVVQELDLKKVLRRCFRPALAKLVYEQERTNEKVRSQISALLCALEDPQFVHLIQSAIHDMLGKGGKGGNNGVDDDVNTLDVASAANEESALALAGTFQAALHHQVLDAVSSTLAIALGHADRADGLTLLGDRDVSALWLDLFKASFQQMSVFELATASRASRARNGAVGGGSGAGSRRRVLEEVEVPQDGMGGPFSGRLPFSFFIRKHLDALRAVCEQGGGEAALAKQFSLLCLGHGIDGVLPDNEGGLLKRYVFDFTCLQCTPVDGLTREEQASFLWDVICVEKNAKKDKELESSEGKVAEDEGGSDDTDSGGVKTLAGVHFWFWQVETNLSLYFSLMNAVSRSHDAITNLFHVRNDPQSHDFNLGVLEAVVSALEPQNQGWAEAVSERWSAGVYEEWVLRVTAAQPFIESLLDLVPGIAEGGASSTAAVANLSTAKQAVLDRWAKLTLYEAFVHKICVPLSLKPQAVLDMVTATQPFPLDSADLLGKVLSGLAKINEDVLNEAVGLIDHSCLCPITSEKMVDPVLTIDGFTFERTAIFEWFSLGNRLSPLTNMPLTSTTLRPNIALKARIDEIRVCDLGGFLEGVVLDLVLATGARPASSLSDDLLKDLVGIVAGECPPRSAVEGRLVAGILPGPPGRVALLRELLRMPSSNQLSVVKAELTSKLSEAIKEHGYLDSPLAVAFASVYEETTPSSLALTPADMEDLALSTQLSKLTTHNILQVLSKIAEARRLLVNFADLLISSSGGTGPEDLGVEECAAASKRVEPLLLGSHLGGGGEGEAAVGLTRSMRMFLLKQLEQRQGVSFARGCLQSPPLSTSPWVVAWRKGDNGFLRFLGTDSLPRFHPLAALPTFARSHLAVTNFLAHGDLDVLVAALQEAKTTPPSSTSHAAFKGGLLAALFQDIFLLSLLPRSGAAHEAYAITLHAWLRSRPAVLEVTSDQEHGLFLLFSGALHAATAAASVGGGGESRASAAAAASRDPQSALEAMRLEPTSAPEKIIRVQLLAHLAAASLSAEKGLVTTPVPTAQPAASTTAPVPAVSGGDLLSVFQTMMLSPASLQGTWLPTMPEDTLKMAQEALGGRWYRCPNGHPFYVDLCGRPTVIQTCAECGAQIGGTNHNLLETNQDIGDVGTDLYKNTELADSSEPNYCLRPHADEAGDVYMTSRGMNPTSLRATRFLMHGALVVGAAAATAAGTNNSSGDGGGGGGNGVEGASWGGNMVKLMNPVFTGQESVSSPQAAEGFLLGHYDSNWTMLKSITDKNADDLSVLLHLVLLSVGPSKSPDTDHPPVTVPPTPQLARNGAAAAAVRNGEAAFPPALAAALAAGGGEAQLLERLIRERGVGGGTGDGGGGGGGGGRREEGDLVGDTPSSSSAPSPSPLPPVPFTALRSTAQRSSWERELDRQHISRILNAAPETVAAALTAGAARFGAEADGDEGGAFRAELAENFDPAALSLKARASSQLELWRYRRPFSLAQFSTALERLSNGATSNPFPALSHFLAHEEMLRADCLLPKVLEFIRLLLAKYNRRLNRETARKTSVGEVLAGVGDPFERAAWEDAFDGFATAWNKNWQFVGRFECLEVPKEYAAVVMSRHQAVSFCLPCDSDEGICSLALVQHLRTEHNNLVHSVDERMLTGKASDVHARRREGGARVVSSRHLTAADTVRYDLDDGLVPYLAKHCVTLEGGFDFGKAEARLLERHLARVPVVDLELRAFSFSHEQHLAGGLAPLKAKVLQEPLAKDTREAIAREFGNSPAKAARVLEQLETVVAFLAATGGSFVGQLDTSVGELLLSKYVKGFLLVDNGVGSGEDDAAFLDLGRTVSSQVQLKHIEALWEIVLDLTEVNPFAKVSEKYRRELEKEPTAELAAFVGGLGESDRDALRVVLKAFIVDNLSETTTSDSRPLAEILGFSEIGDSYLCDLEWFQGFPSSVLMACAVESYETIERLV